MALRPTTRNAERSKETRRAYERYHRPKTTERGYGWDWQRFRERVVAERPLCEDCLDEGRASPTEEVHHVIKIKDAPERKLDPTNVRCLCKPHHDKRTARGE